MSQRSTDSDRDLDIRIALVLYGGVSLAIYENGVTRCFYDLVKGQGIFQILLELLGATAQVDVIAGTSAGGINGVLLAATLESGSNFVDSDKLWRDLGDFGNLLREPAGIQSVDSLLKGDTYFQDELIRAFQQFCVRADGYEYPNEIDVFVTGTDLDGQQRLTWDALGNEISDKEHRVVFHLQHRPGRKALGCVDRDGEIGDPNEQGTILGTIARITSSFPAAFPPFRLEHLRKKHGKYLPAVERAMQRVALAGLKEIDQRSFADGGLLDNKPFGPVLQAIFHRMPTGPARRMLFYVEPDPEPKPDFPDPARYTPLAVGAASATISSHETIWNELKELDRHNARVRWFRDLKNTWIEQIARPELKPLLDTALTPHGGPLSVTYWKTRTEGLARSLFIGTDTTTASAEDEIADPARKDLARAFSDLIGEWTAAVEQAAKENTPQAPVTTGPLLNAFDPDFHLRRSFHVLYRLYDTVQASDEGGSDGEYRSAMRFVGRVIKAQKMIRDMMIDLRRNALTLADQVADDPAVAADERSRRRALFVVNLYRIFLAAGARHWEALSGHCNLSCDDIWALRDTWQSFFSSDSICAAVKAARRFAQNPSLLVTEELPRMNQGSDIETQVLSVRWTILDELERAERRILEKFNTTPGTLGDAIDSFSYLDVIAYPLEFTAGMYELDEIKYVRISPQDAQVGLSGGKADEKIAGDELFHFAALLRKDWRSNDILVGRLDGICQIVDSLLVPTLENVTQLQRRYESLTWLFDPSLGASDTPAPHGLQCVKESWQMLCKRWNDLGELLKQSPTDAVALKTIWKAFSDALIRVGQEDAFLRSFPGILQDHYCQEAAFGESAKTPTDPPDDKPGAAPKNTSTPIVLKEAKEFSERFLEDMPRKNQWAAFQDMGLGKQQISGRSAAVPPHVSGEYMTQAYLLLWGMVRGSLGDTGRGVLDRRSVKLMLRHPVAFLNATFLLMRRSFSVALSVIALTTGLLLGLACCVYFFGTLKIWVPIGAIATLLLFMAIVAWAVPRAQNRPLLIAFIPPALFVVILLIGTGLYYAQPFLEQLQTEWFKGFLIGAGGAAVLVPMYMKIWSWRRARRGRKTAKAATSQKPQLSASPSPSGIGVTVSTDASASRR